MVRHIHVGPLILHERAKAIGFHQGCGRALAKRQRLLDARQSELAIAFTFARPVTRELEARQCDGVGRVVQVAEADGIWNARKPCGHGEIRRDLTVALELATLGAVAGELASFHEPFQVFPSHRVRFPIR